MNFIRKFPGDLYVWIAALIVILAIPVEEANHLSICPLHSLGFEWCPGCGLGRSMKLLMVGKWEESLQMHPLGGFGLLVIGMRLRELAKHVLTKKNYGECIETPPRTGGNGTWIYPGLAKKPR